LQNNGQMIGMAAIMRDVTRRFDGMRALKRKLADLWGFNRKALTVAGSTRPVPTGCPMTAAGCLAAPGHTLRASVLHYPQARGALPLLLRLQSASRPDGANRLAQPHQPVKSSNARAHSRSGLRSPDFERSMILSAIACLTSSSQSPVRRPMQTCSNATPRMRTVFRIELFAV